MENPAKSSRSLRPTSRIPNPDGVHKNVSVVGVFVGAYGKPFLEKVHDRLLTRRREGTIRGQVACEIPLEEIPAALERLGQRRSFGKTVVRVGRNT
jgi:NADPH2:quinone reductase